MEKNNQKRTQEFLKCLGNGKSLQEIEAEEEEPEENLRPMKDLIKEIELGGRI